MLAALQDLLSSHLLSKNINMLNYKTIILPVILYGWEISSLRMSALHSRGLRVFVNGVLKGIFRPKRDKVIGGSRNLRKKELLNLYYATSMIEMNKSRRMRWVGYVSAVPRV
jgi:hypothetical protein